MAKGLEKNTLRGVLRFSIRCVLYALMANIELIYSAWNRNAEAMAADLEEEGVTVRQWRNRGSIPPRAWAKIIEKASAKGVRLTLDDFGQMPPEVVAVEEAQRAARDAA